ncbi:MAG: 23S rRNA (adenine(2503)-C(2))-methyltransferase RlmN [Lachnospiraceae bacterium]|nr:23S rRNA (adenine(2503)-C(2))-methyltransferase RlmN [Lachnospiraceae bacterium]
MEKKDIKSMNLPELTAQITAMGEKGFRAKQMYEWMHRKLCAGFDEMTNISSAFREKCKEGFTFTTLKVLERLESAIDGTNKFLFELADGNVIESVLMRYHHGNSVCISSQAGCRMGCRFCASTLNGLARNLTPAEMLEQIYQIQKISGERVSNIVVMGTGEPLDNYDNLIRFLHMISDENGLNISQRNITVSTCGLAEKIHQLAEEGLGVNLALSLHAPNDEARQKIMPIAKKYTISQVLKEFDYYFAKTGRRLTFEYSLVAGVNDSKEQAEELSALVRGKNCLINLIPVNEVKEREFKRSCSENIQNFKNILEKNRINVTIRREMGSDINAACGQLRKSYTDRKKEQEVTRA